MSKQWVDTSTEAAEFYRKDVRDRVGMIFRMRGLRGGYSACVTGARVRCADTPFASLQEAKTWADRELGIVLQERAIGA